MPLTMIIHKPPNHNNVMLHHVVEIQINLIFLHLPLLHILCLRTNMQPFKNAQKTLQNGRKQSLSLHLQFSGCFFSIFFSSSILFEKSNFCPKIQFGPNSNIFTSFSPKIFFDNFSREIKVVNS